MILIKYATRGRPEWFKKTMRNILSTATGEFRILISADEDDVRMNDAPMRSFVADCRNTTIVYGSSSSKVAAINRDMDIVNLSAIMPGLPPPWDILVNMSDDMSFTATGWDGHITTRTREVWGSSLDWFAHFNDGFTKDALPTMSIMGRDYYLRDKYIYHPAYKSFSCDAEAMYVAMMRQRYRYFPEVIFNHQHPSNMPRRGDATYARNAMASEYDTLVYWHRLKNFFEEPVEKHTPIPFHMHLQTAAIKTLTPYPS